MLYNLAHFMRDKMGWLWKFIEWTNAWLFWMRFGKKIEGFSFKRVPEGYELLPIEKIAAERLVEFFEHQPEEAYKFFTPHDTDVKTIRGLQKNRAFMAYVLVDKANGKIAGYCFNKCFFHGQGFRGRMVDIDYRGKGLGTAINRILNEIGFGIGLRLFESVSKNNPASYRATMSSSKVKVLEELPDNRVFLEIIEARSASEE